MMKKIISTVLVVLWMILIFSLSNQVALVSSHQSSFFVNIITNIFGNSNINIITFVVRKCAHFTLYLILGVLVLNALRYYKVKNIIILAILICITYACFDEIHQLFIQGRSGEVRDVLIDSIGSLIGIVLFKLVCKDVNYGNNKTNG